MDILFACWAFDRRWLFGIKNNCFELILTAPLLINIATLMGVFIEQMASRNSNQKPIFFYQLIIVLFLLALTNFIIIVVVRINCQKKLKSIQIQENYIQIHQFFHQFQLKQIIWSWVGAILFLLSISQIFIQKMFIARNQHIYSCLANNIRYYMDLIALIYVLIIILIFFVLKGAFLAFAWGTPGHYLRFKKIVQNQN